MSRRSHSVNAAALLLVSFSLAGCQLLGVIAQKAAGEAEVDAQYTPDKTAPLLVIAEDYREPSANRPDADRVARLVSAELDEAKVAPIVSYDTVVSLRDARPDYSHMSVIDVAHAVGAKQVVYIDLSAISVGVQTGSDMAKGVGAAHVSVIDVDAGRAVFPGESGGMAVNFATPIRRISDRINMGTVRDETIVGLSSRIGRLFHKWKPSEMTSPSTEMGGD